MIFEATDLYYLPNLTNIRECGYFCMYFCKYKKQLLYFLMTEAFQTFYSITILRTDISSCRTKPAGFDFQCYITVKDFLHQCQTGVGRWSIKGTILSTYQLKNGRLISKETSLLLLFSFVTNLSLKFPTDCWLQKPHHCYCCVKF